MNHLVVHTHILCQIAKKVCEDVNIQKPPYPLFIYLRSKNTHFKLQ
jgi:hypothetical protein